MELNTIIGVLGMVLILFGFVMNDFAKRWNHNTIKYNLVNLIGAVILTYYAYTLLSWPFVILNGVWFVVALYKLYGIVIVKKK